MKALIVDDERMARQELRRLLAMHADMRQRAWQRLLPSFARA